MNFSMQEKKLEGVRIATEIKDVKEAFKLFKKLERMYESNSWSDRMDAKIDVYRYAIFHLTDNFFHVYMPLDRIDLYIGLPVRVTQRIGEVLSKNEYQELLNHHPKIEGKFEYFGEDTPLEELVTSKSDETLKAKILAIKELYDGGLPIENKVLAADKILNSSKKFDDLFGDLTAEEIMEGYP